MDEAALIYNPLAGPSNWPTVMKRIVAFWQARGWRLAVQPTAYPGHATQLARQAAAAGRRLVLVGGGDGTLGEVAAGLAQTETVMAPLPMGTGNSFAKELGMLSRLAYAEADKLLHSCELLAAGHVQRMDVGRCRQGRAWLLWTSAGIDSVVVEQIEPRSKLAKKLGPLGYLGEGLPAIPKFAGMQAVVNVDGRQFSGDYLMITISNCRLFAGGELLLNPSAVLDDGQFEIWLFANKERLAVVQYLMELALGRHLDDPDVMMVSGREVSMTTWPVVPFHQDGDPAGQTPFACEIVPGAVRLLVPESAPSDLFSLPAESL